MFSWITPKPKIEATEVEVCGEKLQIERKDAHLPKGLRIGALVSIPEATFIAAQALGSKIPLPENVPYRDTMRVKSISSINLPLQPGMKVYRAYFEAAEFDIFFIQATVQIDSSGNEKLHELAAFSNIFSDTPKDENEWANYLGVGAIGSTLFTSNDGDEYDRTTGSGEFSKLIVATEKGIESPAGDKGWVSELSFHVYERKLADDSPELVITEVFDVKESNVGALDCGVRFLLGIPLPLDIELIQTNQRS